jgi:hypothetical protein
MAGAFVSGISLRRMGHKDKATRVFQLTLLASIVFAVILMLIPDALGRAVGFGVEAGFYFLFPRIQDREFEDWQAAHKDVEPSNGWKALGWAVLGLILFFAIVILVLLGLEAMGVPAQG